MQIIRIDPSKVEVSDRLRSVDADFVAILASSMGDRGLDSPIRVTTPDETGACRLIAGAHRLAAALALGWSEMMALPFDGDALQAELLEIEENLFRRELSELDRSTFLARHKAVWEALHPQVKHGGDRRKQQVDKNVHLISERFSAHAAAKFGFDERTIRRLVRRHEALSPVVRSRIAGTWIAGNGAAIDALVGATEAERGAVLDLLLAEEGAVKTVGAALALIRRLPEPDPAEEQLRRILALWEKTGANARARFFKAVGVTKTAAWMARYCRADLLVLADATIRGASPDPSEDYLINTDFCLSEDLAFDGAAILRTFELLGEALGIPLPPALAVDLALTSPTVGQLVRVLAEQLEKRHA